MELIMKKFLFLMAILIVVAGLMADVTRVAAERNSTQITDRYPTREIFYTEDFESGAVGWTHYDGAVTPNNWHVYNNGDAQGNVWWMGDPAMAVTPNIGGYHNHQYLVLDTPASTIVAGDTNLTYKMRLNMEAPGVSGDFDGWDSFNIRLSTNAGISWTVIPTTSITPGYDFTSSYAFGSEHGETPPVPAWGGVHEPWVSVTVDLSAYVGTSVKIRFAFASDPAYCTEDDPAMYGVMVDDIDFGSYTNNGVNDGQMTWTSMVPTAGDFWHVATDAGAPSPTHIMSSMNSAGTYAINMLNYLESPEIVLPADATQIVADFQLKGSYSDPGVFPDVDYFGFEIFHAGSWHYMSNPYDDPDLSNYVFSSAPDTWASMVNSYTGVDGDITLLAGQTVKFRWYFQSNDNTPIGTPLQIDDFQIFSVTAAPAPPNLVYPVNGATGLPYSGFDLDWTASSLGALPEYYTVYMDQTEENLELATFAPTYTSAEITTSLYNPVDAGLLTFAAGQRWYWRVGASVVGQDDAFSDIFRFDIVSAGIVITTFPWNEGFESTTFPPTNWTRANVDGDAVQWARNTTATYVHSGTGSAYHAYSTNVPDPGQNGWLITPPVELPATGVSAFSFWNYNRYGGQVYNGLLINSNNDPTDPYWVELWTQDAPVGAWVQETVSLADYAGQVVYLGFRYTGYDANNWYVDDVNITVYTTDTFPPTITHLPLLNSLFDDAPYTVNADVQDDLVFNNPLSYVNLYYSIDGGTNWSAAIAMTPGTAPAYSADIPAQALGTTVTYKIEASDNLSNAVTTINYSFQVNDPVWIQYDDNTPLSFTGFPTYIWGPMIYYVNPLYGTGEALKLLAVDGAVHNNNTGNPNTVANLHIYAEDLEGNLTDMITPIPVTFVHRTRLETDLSALNIQITSPYFWISYEDMPLGCYFQYDPTYNYTTLYLMVTGGGIYTSSSTGEWCIGAYVQSVSTGVEAPEISIALVGGNPQLSWDAVAGAASYNVYGSTDPYAADPWGLLGNTTGLTYTYTGTEAMEFFKVTADTEVPTRGSVIGMPFSRLSAPEITVRPSVFKEK